MLYVNKITNDPQQEITLTGIPGLNIDMSLRFMPRIQSWTMGIKYNGLSYQGIGIVISENLLRQFQADLPFGIACFRADGLDPYMIDDFANQLANLYLLDSTDVAWLEANYYK